MLTEATMDTTYHVDGQKHCEYSALQAHFKSKNGKKINPFTYQLISEYGVNEELRQEIALFFKKAKFIYYYFDGNTTKYTTWMKDLHDSSLSYENFKKNMIESEPMASQSQEHPLFSKTLPPQSMFDLFLAYGINVFNISKKDIYTLVDCVLEAQDYDSATVLVDLYEKEPYLEILSLPITGLKTMLEHRNEVDIEPITALYSCSIM